MTLIRKTIILWYLFSFNTKFEYKPVFRSNILLDEKLTAKLSDFGFSIQLPQSMGCKTLITSADGLPGTDGYRPPEYSDRKFSVLSDMYSFGVVSKTILLGMHINFLCDDHPLINKVALECYSGLCAFSEDREGNNLVKNYS